MAKKAFEIQSSDLNLGGVTLQAGTTGVVIPGVTQATNYIVEEVEDTGDQTEDGWTTGNITVIDNSFYQQLVTPGNKPIGWAPAAYQATIDDEENGYGYIDEIEITFEGDKLDSEDLTRATSSDMWAIANGNYDFNNFTTAYWVQIPFRPKMRAGEVETVSGGSGVVAERSISFPYGEEGDTRGTIALTPDGKTYVCVADWEETTQPEEFSALVETTRVHDSIGDERNGIYITLADYPDLVIIRNSTVGQLSGKWSVNGNPCTNVYEYDEGVLALEWTFTFGSNPNRIEIGDEFTVSFETSPLPGPEIWRQLDAGALYNNNDQTGYNDVMLSVSNRDLVLKAERDNNETSADVRLQAADDINIQSSDRIDIISGKSVKISTNGSQSDEYFSFTQAQTLRFPDGTSQQTAYQGRQGMNVPAYKGFEASYARVYENEDADSEYAVSKLVIYKAGTAPMARADVSGVGTGPDDDYFRVNGLGGTDIVAMFVFYRNGWQAESLSSLKSAAEYAIDNIILINGFEGQINTVTDMKSAFYANYTGFANNLSLDGAFEFYDNSWSYLPTTSTRNIDGNGLVVSLDIVSGSYANFTLVSGGADYVDYQSFIIPGGVIGGVDGVNDYTFQVVVDGTGAVTAFINTGGTAVSGDASYTGLSPEPLGGTGATIFINAYNHTDDVVNNLKEIGLDASGVNYEVGDQLVVLGNQFSGGTNPTNNVIFTVTAVNSETSNSITGIEYTSGTIPPHWPSNNIDDGGRDQYDNANYIFTSVLGDSWIENENDDTALPYNNGNVIPSGEEPHFGPSGTSVAVYKSGIFGLFARDIEIDWLGTNGNSGADGESSIDCGSLYRTESAMFRADGSIELPTINNQGYEWGYDLTGPTLKLGNPSQQVIITGPKASIDNTDAQRIVVQGQRGYGEFGDGVTPGEGGDVYIWGGLGGENEFGGAGGSGGDVKVRGGQGQNAEGGYVKIEGGDAYHWNNTTSGNGGYIDITAGDVAGEGAGPGGGGATLNQGGSVNITAGRAWEDTTKAGVVNVTTGGHMISGSPAAHTWTFKNDGSLQLPAGGDVIDSNGTSVLGNQAEVVGDGSTSASGFSIVFYTDYQGSQSNGPTNTSVSIASYNGLAIGDFITFRGGEVRTITAIDLDTPEVNVTQLTWVGDVENSVDNPMFPITITSSDYIAEVKPTARIKPNADYVALGQYMEIYTGGAPSTMDDLGHIHMKGHSGNVELFLGTDDNFVSTKEAGTTPGHVTMRSETDVKVIETDIRTRRNGSTFISDLGDGYNYHWVHNGQSGDIAHNSMAVDSQGNYYIGGEHTSYAEGMVSKFSKDGSLLWSKLIGGETSNYAWDVPVIAVNPTTDRATALYITNLDRSHNYFKMVDLDADGNTEGDATDFYDIDGEVRPRDMKWHPTLGWVIVGMTAGDALVSASLSPQPGSGVGRLVLDAAATDLKGNLMTTYDTSWYLGGDNISGKQLLDSGIGLYRSVSVVNVTVANPAAAGAGINVRINYAGGAYFGIDGMPTPGSNYTTGDTVKVLGTDLGGLSPQNDVTFIIVADGGGGIAGSSGASGTPNIATISLDMAQLGYTSADFSTGSYIVYKQVSGRPFVWTNTWKKFLDVEDGYNYGYASAVDFSSDGEDIFVSGYTDGSRNAAGGGGFLWALTDAGATSWVKGLDTLWEIRSIAVSDGGAVYAFSSGMGTDITMFSGANGAVLNRIELTAPMGGRGHIDTAVDEAGNECLYVVWSEYSSPFTATNNGMAVQKFTLLLDLVWSRHMYLSNGLSLYSDYDSNYKHFALTPTQAAVVGYGLILDNGYDDGQLWTLSITDDFEPTDQVGDVNGIVTGVVDLPWSIASDEYIPLDLTAVLLPQTSGLQVQTQTSTFTWNTLTWQNRILNGNFETKGLADIEKINFVQGDNLGHNPVDVPLSTQHLQVDDPMGWNITLRMTDRGKFIKNRATPAYGNIQDLVVNVPKSSDVPFPIGTVITLMNLDTSNTYYIYVQGAGWVGNESDRPIIWAAGETVESTWSFGGLQTATLMKIGNNDWLLTANNVIDASL